MKFLLALVVLLLSASAAIVLAVEEPKCTGDNEVFLSCGTACPESCPFRDAKTGLLHDGRTQVCNKMCKVGCACAYGFVRDLKRNGECVERSLCSPP